MELFLIALLIGVLWFLAVLPAGIGWAIGVGISTFLAVGFVFWVCVSGGVEE